MSFDSIHLADASLEDNGERDPLESSHSFTPGYSFPRHHDFVTYHLEQFPEVREVIRLNNPFDSRPLSEGVSDGGLRLTAHLLPRTSDVDTVPSQQLSPSWGMGRRRSSFFPSHSAVEESTDEAIRPGPHSIDTMTQMRADGVPHSATKLQTLLCPRTTQDIIAQNTCGERVPKSLSSRVQRRFSYSVKTRPLSFTNTCF